MDRKDQRLLATIKSGEIRELEQFYAEHRQPFIRWAERTYAIQPDDTVDIYQDAVVILYENITTGKLTVLESSLKTYLFAIGKNLIMQFLKNNKDQVTINHEITQLHRDDPAEEELFYQRNELVTNLLTSMGEPCRTILQFYYYHRLSMKAIAERLDYKNEDVAKSQKNRCMRWLKNNAWVQEKKNE